MGYHADSGTGGSLRPQDVGIGALFVRIADAVVVADADTGQIVLWNPAAERLLGYGAAEAVGRCVDDVLVPDHLRARHGAGLAAYRATGRGALIDTGTPVELPALHKDGIEVPIELTLSPLEAAPGEGRRYILALIRDARPRREAEAARARLVAAEAAAAEQRLVRDRLRVLSDASRAFGQAGLDVPAVLDALTRAVATGFRAGAAVRLLSEDGRWLVPSAVHHTDPEALAVMRGIMDAAPMPAVDGTGARLARATEPLLLPRLSDADVRAIYPPEYWPYHERFPIGGLLVAPLRTRDRFVGTLGAVRGRTDPPFTPDDAALLQDLADRAAAAVDSARAYAEAREAVEARDRFLEIAAHELKTPLTSMLGTAQLLARAHGAGRLTPQALGRHAEMLTASAQRLARLVDDLLDIARLRTGQLSIRREPTDVAAVVRAVVAPIAAPDRVVLALPDAPCWIDGDADRLAQVVENLLDNGLKYSPDGGPVRVTVVVDGDRLELRVADHGIGLPPDAGERIFEPFVRAANAEALALPGMGLGLHICRHVVEQHGGRIRAESDGVGRGTTVVVELRRRNQPAGA